MIKRIDNHIKKNKNVYLFSIFIDINIYIIYICLLSYLIIKNNNITFFHIFGFCLINAFLCIELVFNLKKYIKTKE